MKNLYRPPAIIALATIIVLYPAARIALPYLDVTPLMSTRNGWWHLWIGVLIGHWLCFSIGAYAISKEPGRWSSIGLDWRWVLKHRTALVIGLIGITLAALITPHLYYDGAMPEAMRSHPLGPVTTSERLFWIVVAISAGIVEETMYRGFAITWLREVINLPIAIVISTVAFALMHGPSAFQAEFLSLYIVSGLIFAGAFVWKRYRNLHWLILFHAGGDLALVLAP